ncbi:MAG: deoxyribodipyrimidine photo-lyase [Candidatus Azotimanducaceae bacterium]|jgi:deoxyribodipyrimidine photo-lyase
MHFPTRHSDIQARLETIDPLAYGKTRNYIDGDVTYLSPYLSRGVLSTRQVFQSVLARGFDPKAVERFVQELCWRDYWQAVWRSKGSAINSDLRRPQPDVAHTGLPTNLQNANTGIAAIDQAINTLYQSGYAHNHLRMYIASLACRIAKCHWKIPAQWMYYHLLDADWASNALSWQWVAGANSTKTYIANQENINRFCHCDQRGTFLDQSYEAIETMQTPPALSELASPNFATALPQHEPLRIDQAHDTLIYNFYNMDPQWRTEQAANRILLLEPSIFKAYPVAQQSIQFMIDLGANVPGLQWFVGEFAELESQLENKRVFYKEHPLNRYRGTEAPRDPIHHVDGYYPSFFSYWKACQRSLKNA